MQRGGYSTVAAVALAGAGLLAGCTRWQETEDIGVFRLTTYMQRDNLDWEGGNTHARKMTLCSRLSDFCLTDAYLYVSPDPSTFNLRAAKPRWILVKAKDDQGMVLFFDTQSGGQLHCVDCAFPIVEWLRGDEAFVHWPRQGDRAVLVHALDAAPVQLLLSFTPDGIRTRRLSPAAAAPGERPMDWRFSPDGEVFAWYACTSTCTLHWYRIGEDRYERAETPCPYNSYLDVRWNGNVPQPEFYWGATERDMCFDASGKPALPKGERPSANASTASTG